jgi:hypothetical protein
MFFVVSGMEQHNSSRNSNNIQSAQNNTCGSGTYKHIYRTYSVEMNSFWSKGLRAEMPIILYYGSMVIVWYGMVVVVGGQSDGSFAQSNSVETKIPKFVDWTSS